MVDTVMRDGLLDVVLVAHPDDVTAGTIAATTGLLVDLVRGGAALGWVDPPSADEVEGLLTSLARGSPQADAALALARWDGKLVGFGYWRRYARPTHRPHADIEKVAVRADAHRRGIGRAIAEALVHAARLAEVEQLTLDLRADNLASYALCTSMGFREYGRLPDFVAVGDERYDKIMLVLDVR